MMSRAAANRQPKRLPNSLSGGDAWSLWRNFRALAVFQSDAIYSISPGVHDQ